MKQDKHKTVVVFRVFKGKDGDVLALFPHEVGTMQAGSCSSYQHVGQHGSADYRGCIMRTRPATETEAEPLKRELERIGYNLTVCKRACWIDQRKQYE